VRPFVRELSNATSIFTVATGAKHGARRKQRRRRCHRLICVGFLPLTGRLYYWRPLRYIVRACSCRFCFLVERRFRLDHRAFDTSAARPICIPFFSPDKAVLVEHFP
jgi:hypothetical protein